MKTKLKLIIMSVCVVAITLLASFCGLWNSYTRSYCEPMVFYPTENGLGLYSELPANAPYYTRIGGFSYLTTGESLDALNSICAEISDEYRVYYAYDVANTFDAKLSGNNSVVHFADNNALKYLKRYITEGNNINADSDKVEVLIGGKLNNRISIGDIIIVTIRDEQDNEYDIDCTVAGKIDATVPLPADANFSPDSYYLQQESLIVFPQAVKYKQGLKYENKFLVHIVNITGATRPNDYVVINVTDYFTDKGYSALSRDNASIMTATSIYFTHALTPITLASGIYTGQIYYIILILATIICCVVMPVIGCKKSAQISHITTAAVSVILFALCSLVFVIASYGCGYHLLTYGSFIAYPLIFCGVYIVSRTATKIALDKKRTFESVYTEKEDTDEE